jgi:hypothetical protein
MSDAVLPIALFALAGVLVGGALSMRSQGAPRGALVVMAALALLALAGGALRLYYRGG